jgi:hypothetical protein
MTSFMVYIMCMSKDTLYLFIFSHAASQKPPIMPQRVQSQEYAYHHQEFVQWESWNAILNMVHHQERILTIFPME